MNARTTLLVMALGLAFSAAAQEPPAPVESLGGHPVYGAPMPRTGVVVSVDQAVLDPEPLIGVPGKFSGQISEVCQKKGCWVVLTANDRYVRVTFKDYEFFVPRDSAGSALVYGTLTRAELDSDTAGHLAAEGDRRVAPGGGSELRIVAQSIMIKRP